MYGEGAQSWVRVFRPQNKHFHFDEDHSVALCLTDTKFLPFAPLNKFDIVHIFITVKT